MVTITDGFVYAIILITLFSIFVSVKASVKRLEQKMKRIDLSLRLILNRMEIEVPSQLSDRVKQIALDPYRKIDAIKLYREETQSGLREAKEAIEEFLESNQEKWK